jgi:hypothetical protein
MSFQLKPNAKVMSGSYRGIRRWQQKEKAASVGITMATVIISV